MAEKQGGNYKDKSGQFRRKFPRRAMDSIAGVLHRGKYFLAQVEELGEGGMSFLCDYVIDSGQFVVMTFRIPQGHFVSLKAEVKSSRKKKGRVLHGLFFNDITFDCKRQIRSFVSARSDSEGLIV